MRRVLAILGAATGVALLAGCGFLTGAPNPAPKTPVQSASQPGSFFLKPGQVWRSLANNTVAPHEVIQIEQVTAGHVRANLFISESGSLIEGHLQQVGAARGQAVSLAGTISEPGLFADTTFPITMAIRYVNPLTVSVDQTVKGSLLNSFRAQPFRLAPGSP